MAEVALYAMVFPETELLEDPESKTPALLFAMVLLEIMLSFEEEESLMPS